MYDELVKVLRETDFSYGCPCGAESLCKDKDCVIIQAADAIEELQGRAKVLEKVADKWCEAVPKWIPVTERLPKNFSHVLGFMAWGGMSVVQCESERFYMQGSFAPLPKEAVTHWMPLPEPPKEEKEDADS